MKRTMIFLLLFMKRLCKKPSFLIILLLMPTLVFGLRMVLSEDNETIYVALLCEDESENAKNVIEDLVNTKGAVYYYRSESVEDLRADVLTGHAECGFVFHEGLWEAMVREEAEGYITVYQNTKTTNADFIKEEIYADMYSYLSYDVLMYYLSDDEFEDGLTDEERTAYLSEKYRAYVTEGGVFTLSYLDGGNTVVRDMSDVAADNSFLMKPVRGTLSLFMLMAAMAGAVFWAIDEKEGVYKTLGYAERPYVNMAVIFIPAFLAGAAALISIYIGGVSEGLFREAAGAAVYCILLTGFANLIRSLTANAAFICSLLPTLTVVCLICCNIVVNAAKLLPGVTVIRLFLPANYYLEMTDSVSGCLVTAGLGFVLIGISVLIDRKKSC